LACGIGKAAGTGGNLVFCEWCATSVQSRTRQNPPFLRLKRRRAWQDFFKTARLQQAMLDVIWATIAYRVVLFSQAAEVKVLILNDGRGQRYRCLSC
jgi:hypothetical protein